TGNGGTNAQNGYATTPCAFQGGATSGGKLAYNLLTHDTINMYFDTTTLHLRPVSLGNPPGFPSPISRQSFGPLNLDSDQLLLHPAGHLVSINKENHKLETLKLPPAPMADADAAKFFLARTASGQGKRPGLMTSPVTAAISANGVILVLEDSSVNNR